LKTITSLTSNPLYKGIPVNSSEVKPESVIRLLCANKLSFCHLPRCFSITMEPHCALKAAAHLFQNKGCFHHNANDRFGLNLKIVLLAKAALQK